MGAVINTGAEQFLKGRTVAIYENEQTFVDVATGEIISSNNSRVLKTAAEPDFIKVYYKTMLCVQGIDNLPLSFVMALACHIGYANEGENMLFFNNQTIRKRIATELGGVGDNMVKKYIKRAVENGLLFPKSRGVYEVNPWLIAKGKWSNIKQLQTRFDFVNGKWERVLEVAEDAEE